MDTTQSWHHSFLFTFLGPLNYEVCQGIPLETSFFFIYPTGELTDCRKPPCEKSAIQGINRGWPKYGIDNFASPLLHVWLNILTGIGETAEKYFEPTHGN